MQKGDDFKGTVIDPNAPKNFTETGDRVRASYVKELRNVVAQSDVVLVVLDARDPEGCRCRAIEQMIMQTDSRKRVILIMNKIGDDASPAIHSLDVPVFYYALHAHMTFLIQIWSQESQWRHGSSTYVWNSLPLPSKPVPEAPEGNSQTPLPRQLQ